MPDVYDALQGDHHAIGELLDRLEHGENAQNVFPEAFRMLRAHLRAEAETFYAELMLHDDETRRLALEGRYEHDLLREVLDLLAVANPYEEEWRARLRVLARFVRNHVAEEEGPVFDRARKALSAEQAVGLGARFEAERERQLRYMEAGSPA